MSEMNKTEGPGLFVVLLGSTPTGRNIEQHDVLFGIANKLEDLTDNMKSFWYKPILAEVRKALKKALPGMDVAAVEASLLQTFSRRDKVHIDAWMQVKYADGYNVHIKPKTEAAEEGAPKLYFINLGGYKENEFEEYHKKVFVVAAGLSEAKAKILQMDFMKEYSPGSLGTGGKSHVDDQFKMEMEADDVICVSDTIEGDYGIVLENAERPTENPGVIGYVPLKYAEQ